MTIWQFFLGLIWLMWSVAIMIVAWAVLWSPVLIIWGIYRLWRWWKK